MHYKKYALYNSCHANLYLMQFDDQTGRYVIVKPLIVNDITSLARSLTFSVSPWLCELTSDRCEEIEEEAFIHAL